MLTLAYNDAILYWSEVMKLVEDKSVSIDLFLLFPNNVFMFAYIFTLLKNQFSCFAPRLNVNVVNTYAQTNQTSGQNAPTGPNNLNVTTPFEPNKNGLEWCLSLKADINIIVKSTLLTEKRVAQRCSPLLRFLLCSLLCLLQSVGHPADTILAPFTRVC